MDPQQQNHQTVTRTRAYGEPAGNRGPPADDETLRRLAVIAREQLGHRHDAATHGHPGHCQIPNCGGCADHNPAKSNPGERQAGRPQQPPLPQASRAGTNTARPPHPDGPPGHQQS